MRKENVLIISRHPATIRFIKSLFPSDFFEVRIAEHIDKPEEVKEGIVVGNLPLPLIAKLIKDGKKFIYISMEIPQELRGKELNDEQVRKYICLYDVNKVELEKWPEEFVFFVFLNFI